MKIYAVGGAIRDELLGLPVQDYDYLVVGSTPEQMMARGYRPVGQDFPVFLHPRTQAEYALARTERKTARGYHGFQFYYAPDVTLEQDLARRDLTINAMARATDLEGKPIGPLIDPYQGQADLQAGILRHVSPAFSEDPVRILRVARFAARLPGFTLASETLSLMSNMVAAGEVDALVPERVWQEFAHGLMTDNPWHMFEILHACGALARLLPELDSLFSQPNLTQASATLQRAAAQGYKLPVRFATLTLALLPGLTLVASAPDAGTDTQSQLAEEKKGKKEEEEETKDKKTASALNALCHRLKAPNSCRELALLVAREIDAIDQAATSNASELVQLLERCDALRKPARFAEAVQTCEASRSQSADQNMPYPRADRLREALLAMHSVDAGAIATQSPLVPTLIKQAVHEARVAAVEVALLND